MSLSPHSCAAIAAFNSAFEPDVASNLVAEASEATAARVEILANIVILFFNYKSCSGRLLLNGSDVTFCPFFILIYMKTEVDSNKFI